MRANHPNRIAAAALAAALGACSDGPPTAGTAAAPPRSAAAPVEHATVAGGGYTLTLYPGWARVATLRRGGGGVLELYHNRGVYRLPAGLVAPSPRHELRLEGGAHGREVAVGIEDPQHQLAAIRLHLRGDGAADEGGDTLEVENIIRLCPPDCSPPGTARIPGRRLLELPGRLAAAAPPAQRTVHGAGYELTLTSGFARSVVARAGGGAAVELYRAEETAPGTRHLARLRGGPYGRDLTLRLDDPRDRVAGIVLELHAPGYVPGWGRAAPPSERVEVTRAGS